MPVARVTLTKAALVSARVVTLMLTGQPKRKMLQKALKDGASDTAFYETKIATGRYYMARQLPATALHLCRIESGADTVMALEPANFLG